MSRQCCGSALWLHRHAVHTTFCMAWNTGARTQAPTCIQFQAAKSRTDCRSRQPSTCFFTHCLSRTCSRSESLFSYGTGSVCGWRFTGSQSLCGSHVLSDGESRTKDVGCVCVCLQFCSEEQTVNASDCFLFCGRQSQTAAAARRWGGCLCACGLAVSHARVLPCFDMVKICQNFVFSQKERLLVTKIQGCISSFQC